MNKYTSKRPPTVQPSKLRKIADVDTSNERDAQLEDRQHRIQGVPSETKSTYVRSSWPVMMIDRLQGVGFSFAGRWDPILWVRSESYSAETHVCIANRTSGSASPGVVPSTDIYPPTRSASVISLLPTQWLPSFGQCELILMARIFPWILSF